MISITEFRSYTLDTHEWIQDRHYKLVGATLVKREGIWFIAGSPLDDRDRIHLFPLYNFKWPVGMLQDSELYKFRFVININGVYYPAWWILDHIAEVQVELDRIRTEELLEEIDR